MLVNKICGVGNAILDYTYYVDEDFFQSLGKDKSRSYLQSVEEQTVLRRKLEEKKYEFSCSSGGSVANTIYLMSKLGSSTKFFGRVGKDKEGEIYVKDFKENGVDCITEISHEEQTGTCIVLVTPDAERTMFACLSAAAGITAKSISEEDINDCSWLLVEGYLLADDTKGPELVQKLIDSAEKANCKIAFTCSDPWVVTNYKSIVEQILLKSDLFVANEHEACALAGVEDPEKAFGVLKSKVSELVITLGKDGAMISVNGESKKIAAVDTEPTDVTGAGDAFLASYLHGISLGSDRTLTAQNSCLIASEVIKIVGPRLSMLPQGLKW